MTQSRFGTRIRTDGPLGNIYVVLGSARRFMREIGLPTDEIEDFTARVHAAQSYGAALNIVREYFPVDESEDE